MFMNIKEYFDIEMKTAAINIVAGVAIGYASFALERPMYAVVMAIAAVVALTLVLGKAFSLQKDKKWWISNGIVLFLFAWFITWTIFYDIRLIATLPG